jgi:probable rRNA maturation factor
MFSQKRPLNRHQRPSEIDVPVRIDLPTRGDFCEPGDCGENDSDGCSEPPPRRAPVGRTVADAAEPDAAIDSSLEQMIGRAVRTAAQLQGFQYGQIGVLITNDAAIHEINLQHLSHDYPTDVISFDYRGNDGSVEGELVVSLCTARRSAQEIGWDWQSELLLYVIHGTLHICGLHDTTEVQQQQMRSAERTVLDGLGISLPDEPHSDHGTGFQQEEGAMRR